MDPIKFAFLIVLALICVSTVAIQFGGEYAFTFAKVNCTALDKTVAEFEYCKIRPVKRYLKEFSLKVKIFKVSVNSLQVRLKLLHKTNGYRPFLYDLVVDVCGYMKRPYNPIAKIFFCFMDGFTNINHTCPYNGSIVVSNLPNSQVNKCISKLPFPDGEYAIVTTWVANNISAAEVTLYMTSELLY